MAFPRFRVRFKPNTLLQVRHIEVELEASSAETAIIDARQSLSLSEASFDVLSVERIEESAHQSAQR